jgi:hypothetical protein
MKMKQLELEKKEGTNNKSNSFSISKNEINEIATELIESNSKTRNTRTNTGKGLSLKKY